MNEKPKNMTCEPKKNETTIVSNSRPITNLKKFDSSLKMTESDKFASPSKIHLSTFSQFVRNTFNYLKTGDNNANEAVPVAPIQPVRNDSPSEPAIDFDDLPEIEENMDDMNHEVNPGFGSVKRNYKSSLIIRSEGAVKREESKTPTEF
jgi:hypothetical protein